MAKTTFVVCSTDPNAKFTMAYTCNLDGLPVVGFGDDMYGLFVGTCPNGHRSTMMAS